MTRPQLAALIIAGLATAALPALAVNWPSASGTTAPGVVIENGTNGGNAGPAAQGSTTAGQSGPLVQGAVTTAAPTYTTGQTDPISLDTSGNLRVTGGVAQGTSTAGQTGSLVMGASTAAPPTYSEGTTNPVSTNLSGAVRVIPQAAIAGGASFTHIAAGQATTTVKSGAGTLYSLIFDGPATATNTTTIYDNTAASGTIILVPLATTVVGPTAISFGPVGIAFGTGLTVITAAANGAGMTFVWK